jgi:hypothetical protein
MDIQWANQFTNPVTSLMAYVPVVATVVTTILSVILARATLRYAEASDKSLALAREEYEREWSPELHIKLEKFDPTEARIIVTNLAKISVLLQLVQWRRLTHASPALRWFLNEPLVGGRTWTESIGKRLIASVGEDFQGPIAVSVTFFASGRLFRTDWFRFQIEVRNGEILRLDPVNLAAGRVRVLEPRNDEPSPRRALVRDVTAVPGEPSPVGERAPAT